MTNALGGALLFGSLLGCVPQSSLPGTICEPHTDADLQAIAAGERHCSSVSIAETQFENLDGLRGLTSVPEAVSVFRNEHLADLTGLEDLSHVGGITVSENPSFEEVDLSWHGQIGIVNFSNNANLRALSISLDTADSYLGIGNEAITSLTLANPAPTKELRLTHLPELASLGGLAGLASVEIVLFYDLPSMPAAEVESFLAGLDPAPSYMEICDVEGYPGC
ncbi:MAG: hypothetical protein IT383_28060 [Deltaproteobacteria bacterium]|nr:hypothetical protein [Deltaproteobacteria bacterium]